MGSTPLGQMKGARVVAIEEELFSRGDAYVMPRTPHLHRTGSMCTLTHSSRKSMIKPSIATMSEASVIVGPLTPEVITNTIVSPEIKIDLSVAGNISDSVECAEEVLQSSVLYAFSEAGGWRDTMEDRVAICAPLIPPESSSALLEATFVDNLLSIPDLDLTQWSLFAVLDGHGGDFASSYVSEILPGVIISTAVEMIKQLSLNGRLDKDSFYSDSSSFYTNLMRTAFIKADDMLANQNRMTVKLNAKGRLSVIDKSGTTCIACLLTPTFVVVSNVGDSRAVLGQRVPTATAAGISSHQAIAVDTRLEVVPLSEDHKPSLPHEEMRIVNAVGCR